MKSKLTILYEDNHLLVVDKPSGLATVGVRPDEASLVKIAKDYLKQKYQKPGNVFLGVVSRLDAGVSGVIVLARTSKAAARLSEQFRGGQVAKRYWAIVAGRVQPSEDTLVDCLAKDDSARRMRVVQAGQRAELSYRVLGQAGGFALLEVALATGRKHQIRTQLAHRGWPIVGDRKYGSSKSFAAGIALHSAALQFTHPTRSSVMTFRSVPPVRWNLADFRVNFADWRPMKLN
jgi:23S rRNA pseudouridine1911/1915/1917 synthase